MGSKRENLRQVTCVRKHIAHTGIRLDTASGNEGKLQVQNSEIGFLSFLVVLIYVY